jgi:hypothetical protein
MAWPRHAAPHPRAANPSNFRPHNLVCKFQNKMKNRLTWLLLAVIAFDFAITLLGQPSSYWRDPRTANEGNPVFAWFMVRGTLCYAAFILAYLAGVLVLVRMLPRRAAITTGLVFLLSHYFAASTWLSFHFNLGMGGPIVYAVVLSIALLSILPLDGCARATADPDAR